MLVTDLQNSRKLTDWTKKVVNLPVLAGMVNAMGLFEERGSAATSITFTRDTKTYTILPLNDRRLRDSSAGKKGTKETFALSIPYINHLDTLTTEDILEYREWDDPNMQMSVARATAEKIDDAKVKADQTKEFLKLSALKGLVVDPTDGTTVTNMFTELGGSQTSVDFLLGTGTTDITAKINTVLRTVADNNRSGLAAKMPIVLCGNTFFDELISHADIEGAYVQYLNRGTQKLRDNVFDFTAWGAVGYFEHRGLVFVNYAPSFSLSDGTSVSPIAAADGYVINPNVRDLYRGYNGPSNKFSKIGQAGAPLYMYQWAQDKDNGIDFEMEMSNLFFMTNPLMSVKVTTSN